MDSSVSGAGLAVGSASQFQVDGTGNATTANLNVNGTFSGYTGSFLNFACTRATCSTRLDVTGTGTFNSVSTNSLTTGGLVDTGGLTVTGTGAFGNVACTGAGTFGSVTVSGAQADISAGGNLTSGGSYGAWAIAQLCGTSYGTGNQNVPKQRPETSLTRLTRTLFK